LDGDRLLECLPTKETVEVCDATHADKWTSAWLDSKSWEILHYVQDDSYDLADRKGEIASGEGFAVPGQARNDGGLQPPSTLNTDRNHPPG
jgi:hypothetical protein